MGRKSLFIVGILVLVGAWAAYSYLNPEEPVIGAVPKQPFEPDRSPEVDLKPVKLAQIEVGTVIGEKAPAGWSNLVMIATPTLEPAVAKAAPQTAVHYAKMFKFCLLANVERSNDAKNAFYLQAIGRGFAVTIGGKETIISVGNTRKADLGTFGKRILAENEKILDQDVLQVARTANILIFDAQSVMRRDGPHVGMVMRHALVVDPASGELTTFVWLLSKGKQNAYELADDNLQMLPPNMHEPRFLSVDRSKFTLGIPDRDAFALVQLPQGTAIAFNDDLKKVAGLKQFKGADVAELQKILLSIAALPKK